MKFSLRALLYVTAMIAASLAVFGIPGLQVAALVLLLWGKRLKMLTFTVVDAVVVVVVMLVLVGLMLPAVTFGHPWRHARLSLTATMLAAVNYESSNGHLPPPRTVASDGTPLHSWRTLLWPFMEEGQAYKRVDLTKPWNDPANANVQFDAESWQSLRLAHQPSPGERYTNFLAVVDAETAFPPSGTVRLADITDGPDKTIAFIEVDRTDIDIMEPRDLTMDEAIDLLTSDREAEWQSAEEGYFFRYVYINRGRYQHRLVAFLDGHVEMFYGGDRKTARALLTIKGGEWLPTEFDGGQPRQTDRKFHHVEVRWGNVWGVSLFVLLALAPAMVRRSAESERAMAGHNDGDRS